MASFDGTRVPASALIRRLVALAPASIVLVLGTGGVHAAEVPTTFPTDFACEPNLTRSVSQTVSNGDFVNIPPGGVHITVAAGGTVSFLVTGFPQFGGLTFDGKVVINAPIDVSSKVKGPASGDLIGSLQSTAGTSFTFIMSCVKQAGGGHPPPPPPPRGGGAANDFRTQDGLVTVNTIGQNTFSMLNGIRDTVDEAFKEPDCSEPLLHRVVIEHRKTAEEGRASLETTLSTLRAEQSVIKAKLSNTRVELFTASQVAFQYAQDYAKIRNHLLAQDVEDTSNEKLLEQLRDGKYPVGVREQIKALIAVAERGMKENNKYKTLQYQESSLTKDLAVNEASIDRTQQALNAIPIDTKVECPSLPPSELSPALEDQQRRLEVKYADPAVAPPSAAFDALFGDRVSASPNTFDFYKRSPLGYASAPILPGRLSPPSVVSPWSGWVSGGLSGVDRSGAVASNGLGGRADVGVDYRISPTTLVGAFLGYEGEHLDAHFTGGTVDENAFVLGAYAGFRLPNNWVLALAGGGAVSRIDSSTPTDSGSTNGLRGFVSASLSDTWRFGRWRLTPSGQISYASERQDAYVTEGGVAVPGQTVDLGRASLGPSFGYALPMVDPRWQVELFGDVALDYDFGSTIATAASVLYSPTGFGGELGSGVRVAHDNISGQVSASYDSLGRSNESAWSLNFGVSAHY